MIGFGLRHPENVPTVCTCCGSSFLRATLRLCCASDTAAHRPRVPCSGCDGTCEVIIWCAWCGKECVDGYASYDAVGAAQEWMDKERKKTLRAQARMKAEESVHSRAGK